MSIPTGEVIAVNGVKVTLKIYESSNLETIFFNGKRYKGVSIREFVKITRGFIQIICVVEGEYLDEKRIDADEAKTIFVRKVEVRPIGYISEGNFFDGIKYLPMIRDVAYLLEEEAIKKIFSTGDNDFIIGNLLKEDLPISLPWKKIFNTHIGIFGNTGSGKSNTLALIYTRLFEFKKYSIGRSSKFFILDYNGEYTRDQLSNVPKKVYILSTRSQQDRFPISDEDFWDIEVLSILFRASEQTQKPFLNRMIKGRNKFKDQPGSLTNYAHSVARRVFTSASPKRELLELLRHVYSFDCNYSGKAIFKSVKWHGISKSFYLGSTFFNGDDAPYDSMLEADVSLTNFECLDPFDQLIVRINLQLISDLLFDYVQFDFVLPLLKRVESSLTLRKVLEVKSNIEFSETLTVISFRECNQEAKKVLPLLIVKNLYQSHKFEVESPPNKTMHLIIDEAHNILADQSLREQETWKDFRLELFEEIIKEGRKFGFFLTISSQRPADISPTIMSQIHNFMIHRLVNERDLYLLGNTVSTLDTISKEMIPNLSVGTCIVTGSSIEVPFVIQMQKLNREHSPDSDNVDLDKLWELDFSDFL